MAGRATLTVEEAMDEARREARTRLEAISTDGGERDEKKRRTGDGREGLVKLLMAKSWTAVLGVEE